MTQSEIRKKISWAQWGALLVLIFSIIIVCNRGLDFTDESYYIFWTVWPNKFDASIHPFGIFFHTIFFALGKSIVYLRVFGIILLTGCAVTLGVFIRKYYRDVVGHKLAFDPRALTALFALNSYTAVSILTPSYNLLANAAGCLVLAGALGWMICDTRPAGSWFADVAPSLLVGVGGGLAFFAKPTFAALAAIAIALQLVIIWRHKGAAIAWRRAVIAATACVVPVISIIAGTIGLERFVSTFQAGSVTLNFGNGLASLPYKTVKDLLHMPPPLILTILACALVGRWKVREHQGQIPRWVIGTSLCVLILAFSYLGVKLGLAVVRGNNAAGLTGGPTLTVVLAVTMVGLVRSDRRAFQLRAWWPIAALLALPFATAFGTANPLVQQSAVSLYAMLLALAIAADLVFSRCIAIGIQAAAAGYTALLLLWSAYLPYGLLAPIWAQTEPLRFAPTGEVLQVDDLTRRYASGLARIATAHHLTPDTPIIDLSGGGPGTALFLNGNAPYYPWIVHIFGDSSSRLADTVWNSLTASQQRRAWIILPADPVFANTEALRAMRRNGRYRLVGRLPMQFWSQDRLIEIWAPPS